MSRTKPREVDMSQLFYPCEMCGASPWQWCVTRTGRWAPLLHSNRFYQWRSAHHSGLLIGEEQ